MRTLNHILLFLLLTSLSSCSSLFEEINTNTNAPIDVQPGLLLRQVIFDYGEQMSYEGFVAGNLLGQQAAMIDFNLFDRHSLTEPQFGGNPWPILYTNLRDNEIMLQKALTNPTLAVYEGPGRILKAYLTMALTDMFGDVPYSEALSGKEGNVTPSYDSQEEIYTGNGGILENLDQAILAIDSYSGSIALDGDILFDGDLEGWKRFANSLKIKALVRISDQENVSSQLQSIFDEGLYLQENQQNAAFDFTNSAPNNFRMALARTGDFNLFIMSETMEEILAELDDPRQATWFRPTQNDPTAYAGLLNGPDASQLSISVADYSLTGTVFREETGRLDANFLTAWETAFLLAEAAESGLIFANSKSLYEQGISQAFEYWQTELPDEYLSTGAAAYKLNGADPIQQIITQKWLANINNGYEGWIEYRRTGFPQLKTISSSLNDNLIPARLPYPADEQALNAMNFKEASSSTDDNSVNSKVWWDVD